MKCYHFSYLLFVINFVRITHGGWGLQEGRTNVMKREWYVSEKYHKKCHFWKWGRCTRYRAKYQYNLYCKTGWSNDYWQTGCIYAICDGKIKSAACNKYYSNDIIRRRDGSTEKSSGGKCSRPNICTGCNNGFYSDGPYCRICPPIDHCNHRDCRSVGDNHCEWCDGEIKPKKSWRAYVPYPKSTKTSCLKACSWRSDSTRCFPGTCAEDLASNCNCMKGFGGHHCDNIIIDVDVKYAEAKLIHKVGATDKIITTPIDPNDPGPQPIRWTNNVAWQTAELEFNSKFPDIGAHPPMDPAGETHYVKDFKYGIIYAAMELRYDKGTHFIIDNTVNLM
ncbi:uncharacterized protein LOC143084122 [Mytilus galloprovincialis]|uniref:uncharacterized protein LOC143084122 n=1 Tax=Mytilus galloprovincialis TaxID=29158 RepID=UPI003F7C08E7